MSYLFASYPRFYKQTFYYPTESSHTGKCACLASYQFIILFLYMILFLFLYKCVCTCISFNEKVVALIIHHCQMLRMMLQKFCGTLAHVILSILLFLKEKKRIIFFEISYPADSYYCTNQGTIKTKLSSSCPGNF